MTNKSYAQLTISLTWRNACKSQVETFYTHFFQKFIRNNNPAFDMFFSGVKIVFNSLLVFWDVFGMFFSGVKTFFYVFQFFF